MKYFGILSIWLGGLSMGFAVGAYVGNSNYLDLRKTLIEEGWMRVQTKPGKKVICNVEGDGKAPGIIFTPKQSEK